MSIDRPTFHESWFRVASLTPRLRAGVRFARHRVRGRLWFVAADPVGQRFVRLSGPAYRFASRLDGRTSVAQAWDDAQTIDHDDAPTQGEAIRVLAQLHQAGMLVADLPGATAVLLRRLQKRAVQEWSGRARGFLFPRIPIFDPDRLLNALTPIFGWLFSPLGILVWLIASALGFASLVGYGDAIARSASESLDPASWPALLACFVVIKAGHELAHGIACKALARREIGGEHRDAGVHTLGVMLLVLFPVPYVDASSASMLRSKWDRAVVSAAGMLFEVGAAAIAAVVWSATSETTVTHAVAWNVMLAASIGTLLFNANPLLRYDGYYILADLIGSPNLAPRSRAFLLHLARSRAFGVKRSTPPPHERGEQPVLIAYGVLSSVYRVALSLVIAWFVATQVPMLGVLIAAATIWVMIVVPLVNAAHHLATSRELAGRRTRAFAVSLGALFVLLVPLLAVPVKEHRVVSGMVEPQSWSVVVAGVSGEVTSIARRGPADPQEVLVVIANPELAVERTVLDARRHEAEARRRIAVATDAALVSVFDERLATLDAQLQRLDERLHRSRINAPSPGTWQPGTSALGAFVRQGDALGVFSNAGDSIVRIGVDQDVASLLSDATARVELLPHGSHRAPTTGTVRSTAPASERARTSETAEFDVIVTPDNTAAFIAGQRVDVRFELPARSLAQQWGARLQRLVQREFES
ncbi:MAG: PqqD family protein [Planctomycetota bacterium]